MSLLFNNSVHATNTEEYEKNVGEYLYRCSNYGESDKEFCEGFLKYLGDNSKAAQKNLEELQNSKKDIEQDITKYTRKINEYNKNIEILQAQVNYYNSKINDIEEDLAILHNGVLDYESDTLITESTIRKRLLEEQIKANTLITHFNKDDSLNYNFLNAFIGDATRLKQMEKELAGLIENRDKVLELLEEIEDEKNKAQENLKVATELSNEVRLVMVEYRRQEAEILKNTKTTVKELDKLKNQISSVNVSLGALASSNGWINPVPDAYVSAGTWHYPESFGGGTHTGIDFAAPIGTSIYAPANGVVLYSTKGCDNNGYLGNKCGSDGITMAGNQIYLALQVEDRTYGMAIYHMNNGSALSTGTVVKAGDKIGEIGNSGNSTGPHAHIEMTYLGTTTVQQYASSWNGDLTFNAGIGGKSFANRCESNRNTAPCKLRPELLFNVGGKN